MKKITKVLLSIFLTAALSLSLAAGALAEAPLALPAKEKKITTPSEISVIIGDTRIKFFGAKPVWVEDSVFVPLRTFCEKLGAELVYDDVSQTVTCSRYDTSVKLTLGSDVMIKTDKSGSQSIKMAAPFYIQDGYAMAPVRVIAAAFGCNVGWDSWSQTVLILDVEGMLKSGPTYSVMTKLMQIGRADKKTYAQSGNCIITLSTSDTAPIKISAEFTGLSSKEVSNLDIKFDLSDYIEALKSSGMDSEDLLMLGRLKNLEASFIVDASSGKIYIRCPQLALYLNIDSDSWISISLSDMVPVSSTASLQLLLHEGSFGDYMAFILNSQPLFNEASLSMALEQYKQINLYYSDESFTRDGDIYTSTATVKNQGITSDFLYQVTIRGDKLISFSMRQNIESSYLSSKMSITMDQNKTVVASYKFSTYGADVDMTMRIKQSETTKTPVSKPDSGKIVDVADLVE